MTDLDKLVRDLVQTYQFSGFINDKQEQRDFFLCYMVMCFLNGLEQGYYNKILKKLSKIDISDAKSLRDVITKNVKYISLSQEKHFLDFLDQIIVLNDNDGVQKMFEESEFLLDSATFESITVADLVVVYERLLQRLQKMNSDDRLKVNFGYQEPPFDFSELIALLADRKGAHKAYDPFATTGESSVSYAIHSKDASITTESVLQTERYIRHKLVLAGVSNIDSKHSYALSPKSNVEPESFDVAFTLFQPKRTSGLSKYEQDKKIKKVYEDGRINSKTIFDKYREHGFIQHILWSLKQDGIGFVVIGKGPLQRQVESQARNLLLNRNVIDAVIQLPPKLIPSNMVPLYVLVLRKNRGNEKNIKFIDASSFCEFDGKCNRLVNLKKLAEVYRTPNEDDDFVSLVNIDDIDRNSALLTVSSYVSSLDDTFEEIDAEQVRIDLLKQQQITDKLIGSIIQ